MSSRQVRQAALDQFLADKHQEGETIEHRYFWKLFGLTEPFGRMEVSAVKRAHLAYAGDMEWLKNRLLECGMDLQNVRGDGFTLLRWVERVDATIADSKTELGKTICRNIRRMKSIPNVHLMNGDQQRRHDAGLLMLQHINAIRRNKDRFGEAS